MLKFAANLSMMFNEVSFLDRFDAAARAGFEAVEFLFPYEYAPAELAARLRAGDLKSVLFNMPPGDLAARDWGIGALPGREAEFRAGVSQALRYAEILGTPSLHAMSGRVPPAADCAAYRATYVENLRYAARETARCGITLLIEPLNTGDVPGYFLNTQAEAHALREEVGADNLKVQMDFYHAQIVEGDVTRKLRRWASHIGHVQIASVPERNEPDRGELSFAHLCRVLDEVGYAGWIGCEYRPAAGTVEGLGWFAPWRRVRAGT